MERNVKISLEKAKEWYNSGNESLKEVALQVFKESELMVNPWETIKTFEDACRVLNISPRIEDLVLICNTHLRAMYKLQIVKRALNGTDWRPNHITGAIYYPLMRYYIKGSSYNSLWKPVANFKAKEDNKFYTLVYVGSSFYISCVDPYGNRHGIANAHLGLLGCKSEEIAKYFGITFGKLIFDAIYGQYNNYTWV